MSVPERATFIFPLPAAAASKVPVSSDTLFRNTLLRPLRGLEMSVRGVYCAQKYYQSGSAAQIRRSRKVNRLCTMIHQLVHCAMTFFDD